MVDHKTLIEGFSQKSKELEEELKEVLKVLEGGKAPSEEKSINLTDSMTGLREAYSEIRAEAQSIKTDIADDQSVFAYKEVFEEFEASTLVAQVESLVITLERFVSVVSDNEDYGAELLPYQEASIETLRILESDEAPLNSKLEISCNSQEIFLEAISMSEDVLLSDAGDNLLDLLDACYSRKVVRGVMRGQYKEVANADSASAEKDKNEPKLPRPSDEKDAPAEDSSTDLSPSEKTHKESRETDSENSIRDESGNEQAAEQASLEDEELDEGIAEETEAKSDTAKVIESLNSVKKPGNVSAASFKKELHGVPMMVRDVLPHISKFGAMSEEQMTSIVSLFYIDWEDKNRDDVKRAIEVLVKKGLLSSFNTENYGVSYVLTSYGKSLLGKESIKTYRRQRANEPYWHTPIRNHPLKADNSIEEDLLLAALAQTDLSVRYLEVAHACQSPEGFGKVYDNTRCVDGRFHTQVQWGYQDFDCLIYSPTETVSPNTDALYVCNEGELPEIEIPETVNAFLVDGKSLMRWEGTWASNNPDSQDNIDIDEENSASEESFSEIEKAEKDTVAKQISPEASDAKPESSVVEEVPIEETKDDADSDTTTTPADEITTPTPDLFARIKILAEQDETPSDEEFTEIAEELLSANTELVDPEDEFSNLAGAITLLAAAASINQNIKSKLMLDQIDLATGLRIGQIENTGRTIAASFPEYSSENEVLRFSAYCLALFAPHMAYDYDLNSITDMFLGDFEEFFPSLVAFKPLLNELNGIKDISPEEGFSDNVLDMMGNQAKRSNRLNEMRMKATELRNPPKIKAKLHGIPHFNEACFGKDSDLSLCMQVIEENKREDADLVRELYRSYCAQDGTLTQIDESIIEDQIDAEWHAAVAGKSTSRIRKLGSEPRKKAQEGFHSRLELMQKWLSYDEGKIDADTLSKLKKKRASLVEIIDELNRAGALPNTCQSTAVLKLMLRTLEDRLNSLDTEPTVFKSLLKTGVVSLDDEKCPIIDGVLNKVLYYEPWRNALRHLSTPFKTFEEVRSCVFDNDSSELFDNFRQVSHINDLMPTDADDFKVTPSHLEQAETTAEDETNRFQDSLEIAYTYGQINEIQKEDLASNVDAFKEAFFSRHDYGCWRQFLSALKRQIGIMSAPLGEELSVRLEEHKAELKYGTASTLLDEAERLLIDEKNYTVVEDYLNRFEAGQTELTDELSAKLHDPDLFSDFISDEVFNPLYDTCYKAKGTPLASFGKSFIKNKYPQDWTARQRESSESLIDSWPVSPKRFKEETLAKLMKSIGFKVRGVPDLVKKEKRELYRVNVKPEVADRTDYRHPISAFGTQIKSPMNVLVLYGNHTPQEIIDVVAAESIVGIAVVFINYPISLAARRQMAEIFHTQKSRLTSFLLVDQVLALHLALHQETERMSLMLKCTLPFTYYQPFVRDSGPTADEMFCGREHELQTIIDPNGASIVYGGRQLGKTALLERAKSLRMKPDDKEYAVYVSILNCNDEESVAQAISDAMKRAKLDCPECSSLREVCKIIDRIIQDDIASRILLLMDESDKFLEGISRDGYSALQPLVDLKRETKNNFKFVLAGLHNVSRMKNATSRNGIFGQLGEPLCIKPLTPNEALQLISRPLTYLGFQVDRYPHLETILTSTNYYPGILQFFGYTLVETMTKQYGDYYRAADGNPPYALHKEQLGAIMNRSELNNSIKEKFRWSLELDPRYFMIARCIALMCYEHKGQSDGVDIQKGFLADEIKKWADDLEILCLEEETPRTYVNLLDEMVDMGILVRPVQEVARYRLRRSSFLNIIGSDLDAVLEDIDTNNVLEG